MRLPNGYGSVYKLSGNRRKPWAARKTTGWSLKDGKSYPVYQFVGYYKTKSEALQALALYNNDPYDLHADSVTLNELYERWSGDRYEVLSDSTITAIKSAWKVCEPIQNKPINELKLIHFQTLFDNSGKNSPTLTRLKSVLMQMYGYGFKYEIIPKDKKDMISYIEIKAGNPKSIDRSPFTEEEISDLWSNKTEIAGIVLMLIYTGLRAGELTNLKSEDVHLEERYIDIKESKTAAGIRQVPIAKKVIPFFQHWLDKGTVYLLEGFEGAGGYQKFYHKHWKPLIKNHRPHDTRHTCISMLVSRGVDSRIIKKIVGHSGGSVTDNIYTHIDIIMKLEAVDKL